jgi:restriction endonuclease S subunit
LKTILKDISSIQTGLFAKTAGVGDIVYLQAKHFDEEGYLKYTLDPDLKATPSNEKHLLQAGDILFAAKGNKNFAALYEIHNQPCIASTSFFVIRLSNSAILPDYLVWFLNHPETQKTLKAQAIGTSMASISKTVLESLEIAEPDLKTQHTILQIAYLRRREKELKHQIESLHEQLIQQQLLNLITGKTQL